MNDATLVLPSALPLVPTKLRRRGSLSLPLSPLRQQATAAWLRRRWRLQTPRQMDQSSMILPHSLCC